MVFLKIDGEWEMEREMVTTVVARGLHVGKQNNERRSNECGLEILEGKSNENFPSSDKINGSDY